MIAAQVSRMLVFLTWPSLASDMGTATTAGAVRFTTKVCLFP